MLINFCENHFLAHTTTPPHITPLTLVTIFPCATTLPLTMNTWVTYIVSNHTNNSLATNSTIFTLLHYHVKQKCITILTTQN